MEDQRELVERYVTDVAALRFAVRRLCDVLDDLIDRNDTLMLDGRWRVHDARRVALGDYSVVEDEQ